MCRNAMRKQSAAPKHFGRSGKKLPPLSISQTRCMCSAHQPHGQDFFSPHRIFVGVTGSTILFWLFAVPRARDICRRTSTRIKHAYKARVIRVHR